MADQVKNIYNQDFFDKLLGAVQKVVPQLDCKSFLSDIHDQEWKDREIKQRMRHITLTLKKHLAGDFASNTETILSLIPILKEGFPSGRLEFIFLPDFIEIYGIEHYELAIKAFEEITKFVSCEFAVRPFIIKYPKAMLEQMLCWSLHEDPLVRRLASEGCRPRLPWAMAIPSLKKNPEPILPILKNLQNDSSESVRRSVANNLNDISKDHPEKLVALVKNWQGLSTETDGLIKHACRTLLKQGNLEVMQLFGFKEIDKIKITEFKVLTPEVDIGGTLEFAFHIANTGSSTSKIRLEYGLYYQKKNGSLTRKVFKISESDYPAKSGRNIHKKHSFKVITTRKFHVGKHQISIIINGQELEKIDFALLDN